MGRLIQTAHCNFLYTIYSKKFTNSSFHYLKHRFHKVRGFSGKQRMI
jgi:hypothetical protein